jgi:hypothetical protein
MVLKAGEHSESIRLCRLDIQEAAEAAGTNCNCTACSMHPEETNNQASYAEYTSLGDRKAFTILQNAT